MNPLTIPLLVCLVAVAAYFVGIFDRPPFEYSDTLSPNGEVYAIVAVTTQKDISKHVQRLMMGAKLAVPADRNAAAAAAYDPEATKMAVGLWFDDPKKHENPRWAMGWAVASPDFATVQNMALEGQEASGLSEELKAVRLGQSPVLKARIPWKSFFTPMIAPMLHWDRAFSAYQKGHYTATAGPGRGEKEGPLALELYLQGEGSKNLYIDYAVLMGDTSVTWNDVFPLSDATAANPQEPAVQEETVAREAGEEQPPPPPMEDISDEVVHEPVEEPAVEAEEPPREEPVHGESHQEQGEFQEEAEAEPEDEPEAEEENYAEEEGAADEHVESDEEAHFEEEELEEPPAAERPVETAEEPAETATE